MNSGLLVLTSTGTGNLPKTAILRSLLYTAHKTPPRKNLWGSQSVKDNHEAQFGAGNVEYILFDVGISIFFSFSFSFFFSFLVRGEGGGG